MIALSPTWLLKFLAEVSYWLDWDFTSEPLFAELHARGLFWEQVGRKSGRWRKHG